MTTPLRPRAAAPILALAAALAASNLVGGCGVGAGAPPAGVTLTVTQDHGRRVVLERPRPKLAGQDTVLRLLQRNATIETRYSGAFVDAIAGVRGDAERGWFYWVDGVAADRGASDWVLRRGDRVWWDRGASVTAAAREMPAVVGSFPAPLVGGYDGRARTVAIRCAQPARAACRLVGERLRAAGAREASAAETALPQGDRRAPIQVIVARAGELATFGPEARMLRRGPKASGVFVRSYGASGLQTLDEGGRPVRVLGPGAGVVAALRRGRSAPVWVITGTDERGVRRAAKALEERTLAHRLAVAVDAGGVRGLPESSS